MAERKQGKRADISTRRLIIDLIKRDGRLDAKTIAESLGLTQMAVRLHLYALVEQKLVKSTEEHRPVGRPTHMWQLTDEADRFFPNGHADLVVNFMQTLSQTFGSEGFDEFLQALAKRKIKEYRAALPKGASLADRVKALAKLRTNEGYMAEVRAQEDGSLTLIENHCPICIAATNCLGLCSVELEIFQNVLGKTASVERTEHIQDGDTRCTYRIGQ
jgi:predicted ArsR family transcriptional regulator